MIIDIRPFTFKPECNYQNGVDYRKVIKEILGMSSDDEKRQAFRYKIKTDLFFFLYFVLKVPEEINHPWIVDRINEVQANPAGYLDCWSREHFKSTIKTRGLAEQRILSDPEVTIGLFSFKAPISKGFLRTIMRDFESNELLKWAFPDVLYENPRRDSPKWSEDDGFIVKRKGNPVESTMEAHGLVEGQPTSRHYKIKIYNDIVTLESVSTPAMIQKTTTGWELSLNLGSGDCEDWYEGTRYHLYDTYHEIMKRGSVIPRIYPGTDNGKFDGKPVFWSEELNAKKLRDMGKTTYSAQILQCPTPPGEEKFSESMLKYWPAISFNGLNIYILCDPANEKHKKSDFTVFIVIGLGFDQNYYIIKIVRDKLGLTERANVLFKLHNDYRPIRTGYEQYGMQSDIQHFKDRMDRETYHFHIDPLGSGSFGMMAKNDRIDTLEPDFQNGRIYLPENCIHVNYEGKRVDMVQTFIQEEYVPYPYGAHDDIFDCLARIKDPKFIMTFPNQFSTGNVGVPIDVILAQMKKEQPYGPLDDILRGSQQERSQNVFYN